MYPKEENYPSDDKPELEFEKPREYHGEEQQVVTQDPTATFGEDDDD